MPVHAVSGGYRWGHTGKVYKTKAKAEEQARAIYASGWREDRPAGRKLRRELAKFLAASKKAEKRYERELREQLRDVHRGVERLLDDEPTDVRHDAMKLPDDLDDRIAKHLRQRAGVAFDRMAVAVNRKGVQAATVLGISPTAPGLVAVISNARDANIKLVENAGRKYAADVRRVFDDPKNQGKRVEELRDLLLERGNVSESRAALIARDQTLKLNAALAQHRQTAAGVDSYVWSTSKDDRVRPMHRELDGQTFRWDDPPETNDDGDTNHPGEDYQCRCIAIPVMPDIDEPEAEEPEAPPGEEEPEQPELPFGEPANETEPEPAPEPEPEPLPEVLPEVELEPADHFRNVMEAPNATMTVADVISGVQHSGIRRWLSTPENQPALSIERKVAGYRKGTEAYWQASQDWSTGKYMDARIHVSTTPKPPDPTLRGKWGEPWTFSGTRSSVAEKVRSNFLHELGHHVHLQGSGIRGDDIVRRAFWKHNLTGSDRAAILRGKRPSPAISRYAMTSAQEYFAESFDAYLEDPEALRGHDPGGFQMVQDVLQLVGIE